MAVVAVLAGAASLSLDGRAAECAITVCLMAATMAAVWAVLIGAAWGLREARRRRW